MSGRPLYLAKPCSVAVPPVAVGDVVRTLLGARLTPATGAEVVGQAADILRRALQFDVSGAYWVSADRADSLSLAAATGLPPEFSEVARALPLADYDQVADLPYNDDHGSCYGDFFAPVIGAFGIRSWLIASLTDPNTRHIRGAILLGSRSGKRFEEDETRLVLSLATAVSTHLATSILEEIDYGLASLDPAA